MALYKLLTSDLPENTQFLSIFSEATLDTNGNLEES